MRLQSAINNHPDFYVSHAVDCLADAYLALEDPLIPRVALIDIGLPDGSGLDLIQCLTTQKTPIDCMVVSALGDEKHVMAALSVGATGYILKDSHIDDITGDLIDLISGGSPISPKIARHLLKHFNQPKTEIVPDEIHELTSRETNVLLYISKGYKRKEIAGLLNISINTIGTHISHIYRKLSVSSNTEAVQQAFRHGLL